MRSIIRKPLSARASKWLAKNQKQLDDDNTIKATLRWTARRPTMNNNGIVSTLREMSGGGHRCMYCGDSEGCDVEHYRPKAIQLWRPYVFHWENFLWICAPCNRLKNADFALSAEGESLLLDPTQDNPWDYFDYVAESGQLAARADIDGLRLERAEATLKEDTTRLLHDNVCESRQRASRHLTRAVRTFLQSEKNQEDRNELLSHVVDSGRPELCAWYFRGLGASLAPFSSIVALSPDLVMEIRAEVNAKFPGAWQ